MPHFDHFPRPGEIDPYVLNKNVAFNKNPYKYGQQN